MIPNKELIDKELDRFEEERLKLAPWTVRDRPRILDMPIDQISKKTAQELAEASYEIRQYNLNLQRLSNRLYAWIKWCNLKLDELASYYVTEVPDNYGWNIKWNMARHNPEICQKINESLRKLTMEFETMRDIGKHIESLAGSIDSIRFTNYKREHNG